MEDLDHLCTNCERVRAEENEEQFRRRESWHGAKNLLKDVEWPDDGGPCPADVLHLALWLHGED